MLGPVQRTWLVQKRLISMALALLCDFNSLVLGLLLCSQVGWCSRKAECGESLLNSRFLRDLLSCQMQWLTGFRRWLGYPGVCQLMRSCSQHLPDAELHPDAELSHPEVRLGPPTHQRNQSLGKKKKHPQARLCK